MHGELMSSGPSCTFKADVVWLLSAEWRRDLTGKSTEPALRGLAVTLLQAKAARHEVQPPASEMAAGQRGQAPGLVLSNLNVFASL